MGRQGLVFLALITAACSQTKSGSEAVPNDAGAESSVPSQTGLVLGVPCTDSIDSIYTAPADPLPVDKGAILRCAKDTDISQADLYALAQAQLSTDTDPATNSGYVGRPFTSGAHVYRILYRTERGDANNSPGYSSAKVFIPDTPVASSLPIVVAARGSRGQAAACAGSKEDPLAVRVNPDYRALAYPLVGLGYAVIDPDLAGYANFGAAGNPISGYAAAGDVAKSTLDGARALKKMVSSGLSDQTVIVGHSQGGHSALAALALEQTYAAPDIHLAGVATFSPLWLTQRMWAAMFAVQSKYPIHTNASLTAISLWYHYSHGELLDGPGHGLDVIAADKRDAVKSFIDSNCWPGSPNAELDAMGTVMSDLFDSQFVKSISYPAALGADCADPLCSTWMGRFAADRPHISSQVPVLVLYGGYDENIDKGRMRCALDRLDTDSVNYKVCYDPTRGHSGIVRALSSYVADWIAARTLGTVEPAACPHDQHDITDADGGVVSCTNPPPND